MVNIYMVRKNKDRKGWLHDAPANLPIISCWPLILGMLMFHGTYRLAGDPVYSVETIGL